MPGTMSRADLRADLQASLHDAASVLDEPGDLDRCLNAAAEDFGRFCPRTRAATLALTAGLGEYPAPADLLGFKSSTWADGRAQPWEKAHPGRLPRVTNEDGILLFSPPPSAHQIAVLGASFRYFYFAGHAVGDTAETTTVPASLRALLILRAQAEACRELAARAVAMPVTLRDGISGQPRNGTPAYLFEKLMAEFREKAVR